MKKHRRAVEFFLIYVITAIVSGIGISVATAALTLNSTSVVSGGVLTLTGSGSSTLDVGAGTLSLQTTNSGPLTTGSGLLTVGGALTVGGTFTATSKVALSNLATTTAANIIVSNSSAVPTYVALSGDATISNTGVLTIASAAVTGSKIASSTITANKLATSTAADIIVVNSANVPAFVALSGDATISNAGVLTIANNAITSAKIADAAILSADIATSTIALSRLATSTAADVIVVNSSNAAAYVALSGDATISNTGVITIANSAITDAKVSSTAAIAGTKISPNFGSQNVTTTGTLALGTSGTPIVRHLSATASLDFGAVGANACAEQNVAVANAAIGDVVALGSPSSVSSTLAWSGYISGTGTSTVRLCNVSATIATTTAATWRVDVWQH
ncbi:hypothetical protein HY504_02285 [Candidatus Wolfebacteria bacterium]|nr:hypothetical protein [Candidatus Wolfebacteria bacterium]